MTLIVETGAGISEANSYIAAEIAAAHFTALGLTVWAEAREAQREQALIYASAYVDSYRYEGKVLKDGQGLAWPRRGASDREGRILVGLPHALRTAVLEVAADFIKSPPLAFGGREVIREKAGPVELAYSKTRRQPSFVFRLLQQIGARPALPDVRRG